MLLYYLNFVILFFVGLSNLVNCVPSKPNRRVGGFDQLWFIQNPPASAFYQLQRVWPTRNTTSASAGILEKAVEAIFEPNFWIIHGLWPQKRSGYAPRSCKINSFNISEINPSLLPNLEKKWPTMKPNQEYGTLWDYEWNKHGSCTTNIPSLKSISRYFIKMLKLLDEFNVGNMLEQNEMVPGGSYPLANVVAAVRNFVGIEPIVKCVRDVISGQQYLLEVVICFDKHLHLENCTRNGTVSCDTSRRVIYPTI